MIRTGLLFWFGAGVLWAAAGNAAPMIIPQPVQVQNRPGTFTLCASSLSSNADPYSPVTILADNSSLSTAQFLAGAISPATGCQFPTATNSGSTAVKGAILLTTNGSLASLGSEGYELTVAADSVLIRAPAQAGLFYGVQTLLQLLPPQIFSPQPVSGVPWVIPCVYVQDQPRFGWRGFMLDVSRHFFTKDEVKRVLASMALHKLNTFHWHLVDDHGWRIQILSYPLLTQLGAWRNGIDYGQNPRASTAYRSTSPTYGGFYTQDEIREVVAYAQQLHINIVPEIELPAHCTSGLYSYPSLGCGNPQSSYNMDNISYGVSLFSLAGPGSWTFFTNVLTEVMGLFPSPYIHTGGDEVTATGDAQWITNTPDKNQMIALGITNGTTNSKLIAYQHWFSTNIATFLNSNGRTMIGWSEFEAGGTVTNAVLMDWQTGASSFASATASNGQYVVMSPNANCYINYYQTIGVNATNYDPYFIVGNNPAYQTLTNVYSYEPIPSNLNSAYTNFILGAQCNLWAEYVPSYLNVEFKMYPRLCALAELTWTPRALKNYNDFTNRLATHEQRLAQMGINYNREFVPQIGSWGPSMPTSPTTVIYDITPYVTKSGEIDVSFIYTTGSDGLDIYSAALLENGTQLDIDTHMGFSGLTPYKQVSSFTLPYYVLRLPWFHPGATYTIQASIGEHGALNSSNGKVFLPNFN